MLAKAVSKAKRCASVRKDVDACFSSPYPGKSNKRYQRHDQGSHTRVLKLWIPARVYDHQYAGRLLRNTMICNAYRAFRFTNDLDYDGKAGLPCHRPASGKRVVGISSRFLGSECIVKFDTIDLSCGARFAQDRGGGQPFQNMGMSKTWVDPDRSGWQCIRAKDLSEKSSPFVWCDWCRSSDWSLGIWRQADSL